MQLFVTVIWPRLWATHDRNSGKEEIKVARKPNKQFFLSEKTEKLSGKHFDVFAKNLSLNYKDDIEW